MQNNTILLGMPGVGKTTIGKLLATMTGKSYIDTDEYIIAKTGKDPAEHFAGLTDIESLKKEIEIISDIEQVDGVIALSGSVPMTDEGMDLVRKWGHTIIQLEASVETITKRIAQRPDSDSRIIFGDCKTIDELSAYRRGRFESLRTHSVMCDREPLVILRDILQIVNPLKSHHLASTRSDEISESFRHAIFEARPSTGLWYRDIARYSLTSEEGSELSKLANEEPLRAFEELWKLLKTDFSETQVKRSVNRLASFRHPDILPFRAYNSNISFLDLSQGPTCAFKDFALQVLTSFVAEDISEHNIKAEQDTSLPKRYMIAQTSTSGDTGPAGGAGVVGQPAICNIIGYPEYEASYVQKQQMHELTGNVFALGFEESFSSIQKSMLTQNTPDFQNKLLEICAKENPGREVQIHAGSFNSINPGRIDAQMIYHTIAQFRAQGMLLDEKEMRKNEYDEEQSCEAKGAYGYVSDQDEQAKGQSQTKFFRVSEKLATVVPSGNGGHVFGALAARFLSGIPGPKIISCNANDFFEKLINHGVLELPANNSAVHQPSVSMIIEYPNNMERLFRLSFGAERTSEIMSKFFAGEKIQLTESEQSMLRFGLNLHTVSITGVEELTRMRNYFRETGNLICPHTANALCAWEKLQGKFENTKALICETASPWKFLASTAASTSDEENIWDTYQEYRKLESSYAGVQSLLEKIEAGFQTHGKTFSIPDYIKPWLGPEISHSPTLSCEQFGDKTLEIVQQWIQNGVK